MMKRKICVVLVDRANYGRMWPVMRAIEGNPRLELQTICAGTMLLERFGQAERVVQRDGFRVDARVYLELEGSVPATMAKSVGLGIIEFTNAYERLKPDVILIIGDRYEALAAAIAAAYLNIPVAHVQGGEVSGSIDECARHAITRFAQLHFPATQRSADYLVRMGESKESIFTFGCPAGDYIRELNPELPNDFLERFGVGPAFNINNPFLLVIYHPVTTEYGTEKIKAEELLSALAQMQKPTIWIWPNIDAGSDDISKTLRVYREHNDANWLHLIKNLDPMSFQKCLKRASCAVGNSSSFIRDSTFSGTPVVLVGDRQVGRETGANLVQVAANKSAIMDAIGRQLDHGRFPSSDLYGSGNASNRIAEKLATFQPRRQKYLEYVWDTSSSPDSAIV